MVEEANGKKNKLALDSKGREKRGAIPLRTLVLIPWRRKQTERLLVPKGKK